MFGIILITVLFAMPTLHRSEALHLDPIRALERLRQEKFQQLCEFVCEIEQKQRSFVDFDRQVFCSLCRQHASTTPGSGEKPGSTEGNGGATGGGNGVTPAGLNGGATGGGNGVTPAGGNGGTTAGGNAATQDVTQTPAAADVATEAAATTVAGS